MRVRHCGKIGDVIYCMAAMKRLRGFSGQKIDLLLDGYHLSESAIAALKPLLESQEYIASVSDDDGAPCEVDFKEWLLLHYDHRRNVVLSAMEHVRDESEILISLDDPATPWLDIDAAANGLTLVNWTGRHLNEDTEVRIDWSPIVNAHPGARFIGLQEDHALFTTTFGVDLPFEQTENLLDTARLIKGCTLFIGNQSSPLAIAHGLAKQVIVETAEQNPNCIFRGRGSEYFGVSQKTIEDFGVDT